MRIGSAEIIILVFVAPFAYVGWLVVLKIVAGCVASAHYPSLIPFTRASDGSASVDWPDGRSTRQ